MKLNIRDMKEIGRWSDLAIYYVDKDGTVWALNRCTGGLSNCGDESEFRRVFSSRYRGELKDKAA